ncbi:mechanosensitive ion channel [Ciceribacter sp. L1K23]|uniref:mechanosensitive ion channel family protein n=1 Tax=Ciceribacter sp. L1K23 TaxID=2820276 RepID=UPI001B816F31|nr:mechanosensitive ion channel domain-containing protein [Ciceribacter sp. L1K23]MBR0556170.1 mechanosensitive ion channel [Ciceribacter sp. L1K23]
MMSLALFSITALCWLLVLTSPGEPAFGTSALFMMATGMSAISLARFVEQIFILVAGGSARSGRSDRLHTMLSLVLYSAAVMLWLHYAFDLDVSGLLATSAVATVIVGLALQATLGNLFTGLSLEIERQLRVGDHISCGSVSGEVVALKWRSIFVRTDNNSTVVLPNSVLSTEAFEIVRRGDMPRLTIAFTVDANVPPMNVLAVIEDELLKGFPGILEEPRPDATLLGFDADNKCVSYGVRFSSSDWAERDTIKSQLQIRLWYALSREGIFIAAPASSNVTNGLPISDDLAVRGQRRRYGPGETIDLDGGAAVILLGSAREELPHNENVERERLAELVGMEEDPDAPILMPVALLDEVGQSATMVIGPYARELAESYARRTGDPRLLYLALASHMENGPEKTRFLSMAPSTITRRLSIGAHVGFGRALGLLRGEQPLMTANRRCELLYFDRNTVKQVVDSDLLTLEKLKVLDAELAKQ